MTLQSPRIGTLPALIVCLYAVGCAGEAVQRVFDANVPPDQGVPPDASEDVPLLPVYEGGVPSESGSSPGCDADACTPTPANACGDGVLSVDEQCDDGNGTPGDGCSGLCRIENGYVCPTPGTPCEPVVSDTCGNKAIEGVEGCDDGNKASGDGCSALCQVEPGYTCPNPGQACVPIQSTRCGDGMVGGGEQCDDGNVVAGDGCDASCKLEPGYVCPSPGAPCIRDEYCGDGRIQASSGETCDDGNSVPGDGCSGRCLLESGFRCPVPGQPCSATFYCGNAVIDPGEQCDDGNTVSGDGCVADCSAVEQGYTCPKGPSGAGGPCAKSPSNVCGDSALGGREQCDDGNLTSGDGCSSTCGVEAGFTCPTVGQACVRISFCGDKKVDLVLSEECDDGNTAAGDGCSPLCRLEPNFVCPTPGSACVSTVVCGDGKVSGGETCDDGNTRANDGCGATCQTEPGYQCPTPGAACVARQCGDGIVAGSEQCDDGNTSDNDGCSSGCRLQSRTETTAPSSTTKPNTRVHHYQCAYPSQPVSPYRQVCTETVCGNGVREGTEQCDDGNTRPYDGCAPNCLLEPNCPNGACVARCGDGVLFDFDTNGDGLPDEQCDDGNITDGDGCSSSCTIETGFDCIRQIGESPAFVDVPVVFRDFRWWNNGAASTNHPDFETFACEAVTPGLVGPTLSGTVPTFLWDAATSTCGRQLTSARDFSDWYRDIDVSVNGIPVRRSSRIDGLQLRLQRQGTQGNYSYLFDSELHEPYVSLGGFFPIDNLGWGNEDDNNFSFTTEFRYWFTYDASASPRLDFSGDDDVWVFVNNRLALDLGGLHPRMEGSFVLDAAKANALGLVDKRVYEVALFHAERHTWESNFRLTLRDFVQARSVCTPTCGDGLVVGSEVCDDGRNDGSYGGCQPGCRARGPYCGDSAVATPPEYCDDGVNASVYGGVNRVCGPQCRWAPYCGDGVVSNGEDCDDGASNGAGYNHCSVGCTLGPRCGDGLLQDIEQCDNGVSNGATGNPCNKDCTKACGDGVHQAGEECDDGAANNVGGYGRCNADCSLGPRCGDGRKNGTELCDDGKNDGAYGTCSASCGLAPYCGDGLVTSPEEACDDGAGNSASAYGSQKCTSACRRAPYCGDKAVNAQHGEICDDGKNDGTPGSCSPDCTSFIPLPACGNGVRDTGEACDDGAQNGTVGSTCDSHCRIKCGNGIRDEGEQCDDGVNSGAWGTCAPGCVLADYCGDGIKNGPEACDRGSSNVSSSQAYGLGVCTTSCTFAPYCGDGRVQSSFGEECDGSQTCTDSCRYASQPK